VTLLFTTLFVRSVCVIKRCGLAALLPLVLGIVPASYADESKVTESTKESFQQLRPLEFVVTGVEDELRENVLLHLGLTNGPLIKMPISERKARRRHKDSAESVRAALQAYGYYSPTIRSHFQSAQRWTIRLDIDLGPPTRFRETRIEIKGEGSDAGLLQDLAKNHALREGNVVSHERYTAFKSSLLKTAYDLGYIDVAYTTHSLSVFPDEQSANIHLVLETGPRYYYGPITIEQDILKPEFVAKFITPNQGDAFENSRLLNMQLGLSETNYFSQVDVDVLLDESEGQQIPVVVKALPGKAARYNASVGYGTDTGPRIGLGADFRRINRRGHRLSSELQLSQVHSLFGTTYSVPIGEVRSESLDFTLKAEQEEVNSVDTQEYRVGASLNQNRWGGIRRLSLGLVHESWRFGDGPKSDATLLIPGFTFNYKRADDPFFAQQGFSYSAQFRGAAEGVVSDVSFWQAVLFGRAVYSLSDRSRFLLRAEYGATVTDAFDNLPPSLRFFTGGSQSVRGYGYKDLSPRDGQGNRIGGKYFATVSAEADYLISDTMGFAAFIDAGDATRDPLEQLKVGAGLGFRYRSPVGMFRLDVAHPFDDSDERYRIHISFGADL